MKNSIVAVGISVAVSLAAAGTAFAQVAAPPAFDSFCAANPSECQPQNAGAGFISLTETSRRELRAVNGYVNRSLRPQSDMRSAGQIDLWRVPQAGEGADCEDYVLLKRRMLLDRGWPSSALLVTVVRDRRGEGHAVLSVATDRGYLVLDNRTSAIRSRAATGYRYYTQQSAENPRVWVSAAAGIPPATVASAAEHTASLWTSDLSSN